MADKKEKKRLKRTTVFKLGGAFIMLAGLACLVIKAFSEEYVDEAGFLHESFYLLPIGFFLLFCGLAILVVSCIVAAVKRRHAAK